MSTTHYNIRPLNKFTVYMKAADGNISKYEMLEKNILSVSGFSTARTEFNLTMSFFSDGIGYTHHKLIKMLLSIEETFNLALTTSDCTDDNIVQYIFENASINNLSYPEYHLRSNVDYEIITADLKYEILKIKYPDTGEVFTIKDSNYRITQLERF